LPLPRYSPLMEARMRLHEMRDVVGWRCECLRAVGAVVGAFHYLLAGIVRGGISARRAYVLLIQRLLT
jgi:hypothetical protein